jgi:hypothetical protein
MSIPTLKPITSSMVTEYGYDPAAQLLYVRFTKGTLYKYLEVPADEIERLEASPSFGMHLNVYIKRNYVHEQVTE